MSAEMLREMGGEVICRCERCSRLVDESDTVVAGDEITCHRCAAPRVLRAVEEGGAATAETLAGILGWDADEMAGILEVLEDAGLVSGGPGAATITCAGRNILAGHVGRLGSRRAQMEAAIAASLEDSDLPEVF